MLCKVGVSSTAVVVGLAGKLSQAQAGHPLAYAGRRRAGETDATAPAHSSWRQEHSCTEALAGDKPWLKFCPLTTFCFRGGQE